MTGIIGLRDVGGVTGLRGENRKGDLLRPKEVSDGEKSMKCCHLSFGL